MIKPEPVGWALLEKYFTQLTFSHETGDKPSEADFKWAKERGHEYVELFTAAQMRQAEQSALERAAKTLRERFYYSAEDVVRALLEAPSSSEKDST